MSSRSKQYLLDCHKRTASERKRIHLYNKLYYLYKMRLRNITTAIIQPHMNTCLYLIILMEAILMLSICGCSNKKNSENIIEEHLQKIYGDNFYVGKDKAYLFTTHPNLTDEEGIPKILIPFNGVAAEDIVAGSDIRLEIVDYDAETKQLKYKLINDSDNELKSYMDCGIEEQLEGKWYKVFTLAVLIYPNEETISPKDEAGPGIIYLNYAGVEIDEEFNKYLQEVKEGIEVITQRKFGSSDAVDYHLDPTGTYRLTLKITQNETDRYVVNEFKMSDLTG